MERIQRTTFFKIGEKKATQMERIQRTTLLQRREKQRGRVDNLASVENQVSHYTSKNRPSKQGLPMRREHLSAEPRHVDASWDQAWWIRFRLMAKTVSWPVNHAIQPSVYTKKPSIEHDVIAIILFQTCVIISCTNHS